MGRCDPLAGEAQTCPKLCFIQKVLVAVFQAAVSLNLSTYECVKGYKNILKVQEISSKFLKTFFDFWSHL
jgi:hypothetical protein